MKNKDMGYLLLDYLKNSGVYVIAQDTYQIIYMNNSAWERFGQAPLGSRCYCILGEEKPCLNCPIKNMYEYGRSESTICKNMWDTDYDVSAVNIMWEDRVPAYMMSFCRHRYTDEELKSQNNERRLNLVLHHYCDTILEVDLITGKYVKLDFAGQEFFNIPAKGDYTEALDNMAAHVVADMDVDRVYESLHLESLRKAARSSQGDCGIICQFRLKDQNNDVWMESKVVLLQDRGGQTAYIAARDISMQKHFLQLEQYNELLKVRQQDDELYRTILEQTSTIVGEYNYELHSSYVSPIISEFLHGNYDGRDLFDIFYEDEVIYKGDRKALEAFLQDVNSGPSANRKIILRLKSLEGTFRWFRLAVTKIVDQNGAGKRVIISLNDIHEETVSQNILKYQADFDELTRIFNKRNFYTKTRQMLFDNKDKSYVLIRMDIDRFKVFNDLFGFKEGDKLLQKIAEQIKLKISCCGTYGRMDRDIFCACVPWSDDRVIKLLTESVEVLGSYSMDFRVTPSFGIYRIQDLSVPVEVMCDRANLALATVKGNYVSRYAFYNNNFRTMLVEEQEIIGDMYSAIQNEEFVIYLQPKYDMAQKAVFGAEALVRWIHPRKGMIPPDKFIPLFEKNGFILKLDEHVWEMTCQTIRRWLDEGKTPYPVSVNISRMHLYNPRLCDILMGLTEKYCLEPGLLELELTESAYTDNPELLYSTMKKLQKLGFVFIMDDFGSGYSSLNMLKDVPVNILKIDLFFLSDTKNNSRGKVILETIISMARALNLPVIAEGVESAGQAEFLQEAGCTRAQGYYFSRPVRVPEFEKLVFACK